jgi:uncharacterized protein YndB with AHSA1/START domain
MEMDMRQQNGPEATIRDTGMEFEIALSRFLDADRNTVWRMLTEPDHLKDWLAPGTTEPRVGGRVALDFGVSGTAIDSRVTAWEPAAVLAYSWSASEQPHRPLRWELREEEGGTRLVLTLRIPRGEDPAKTAAGWDTHLEMLLAATAGVPIGFPVEHFKASRTAFQQQIEGADQTNE